ncbi:MAG: hypothetical protein ACRDWY_14235 [Actinomycetes bacterium]
MPLPSEAIRHDAGVDESGGRRRRTTPLAAADKRRLLDYKERGTLETVMRRTSWRFKAWTFIGFLTLLAGVMLVLWLAAVPDLDLVFRVVALVIAFAYWPVIGAWAVRRSRLTVDRP